MHALELTKPDGRRLTLYRREPFSSAAIEAPSPFAEPLRANPHLRWHPLRGEWVAYAAYRQGRTFLPPPEYNPLDTTRDPANPTELPVGEWEVAVFDNRFPTLELGANDPPVTIVPTSPANGHCEVMVFTQDSRSSLGALPLARLELVLEVWGERTRRLGQLPGIRYVLPFENRGAEVGVTLHHPHGQIYAYPVIPPVPQRLLTIAHEHHASTGEGPLASLIRDEIQTGERILYRGDHAIAFVPVCARYPYEAWVAPLRPMAYLHEASAAERADLARALKTLLLKYDGLWHRPFPYLMAWYQAPTDGAAHPESHAHAELYPPFRTRDKLKYLAGTEIGAGLFAMDALPEDKARELQQVSVSLLEP